MKLTFLLILLKRMQGLPMLTIPVMRYRVRKLLDSAPPPRPSPARGEGVFCVTIPSPSQRKVYLLILPSPSQGKVYLLIVPSPSQRKVYLLIVPSPSQGEG